MRRFLTTLRFVILLTLTDMALTVVVGVVLLFLSCLSEIWEIVMRSLFAIAFASVLFSALPAAAGGLHDLQQRVDDLEMRLNDMELSRLPSTQPRIDYTVHVKPVYRETPKMRMLTQAPAVAAKPPVNCPVGSFCGDGPLLRGDGKPHAAADGRSQY